MNELKKDLEYYIEIKKSIKRYNMKQYQRGLDLGNRIISDLLMTYPHQIGNFNIRGEDDYHKEELVLEIGLPFENNGSFFREYKDAKDYILERYPNAKKHYLGILLAECITKRNIEDVIKELSE